MGLNVYRAKCPSRGRSDLGVKCPWGKIFEYFIQICQHRLKIVRMSVNDKYTASRFLSCRCNVNRHLTLLKDIL